MKEEDSELPLKKIGCPSLLGEDIDYNAEMIIRLFGYLVSMTLYDSITHYSNNH